MKKIIALLLTICLLLSCGINYVFAEEIGTYLNRKDSIDVLESLGVDAITETRGNVKGDSLIEKPVERLELDEESYAFLNAKGEIVRVNRVDEIVSLHNKCLPVMSNASSFSKSSELIEFIENKIVGDEYVLSLQYDFDVNTISLRYEKKLSDGAVDSFDYYAVYIDKKYNELVSLYKNDSQYTEKRETKISQEEAVTIAMEELGVGLENQKCEVKLATVESNQVFDETRTSGEVRLAYIIKNSSYNVYVDAYTGEVLGGDILKAVLGGAIGSSQDELAPFVADSIPLAKDMFQRLGYNTTSTIITPMFRTKVPTKLNYAFYSCSHGSANSISSGDSSVSSEDGTFYASSVPYGTYRFVFLDACNTASSTWHTAFAIQNSSVNKAFLGWTVSIGADVALDFCYYFWAEILLNDTVRTAAMEASSRVGQPTAIRFVGDMNYRGQYI